MGHGMLSSEGPKMKNFLKKCRPPWSSDEKNFGLLKQLIGVQKCDKKF